MIPIQMRQVLAELELVSHGSTQSWNSDGRGGSEQIVPPGESEPPHEVYRDLWLEASSDEARQRVYSAARAELRAIVHRDKPAPSLSDREIMVKNVLDYKGWSAHDVASHFRYTVRQVRDIRTKEGKDPETGEPLKELAPEASRAGWAAKLRDQGLSQSQIAARMSVSQATVSRLLTAKRAA